MIKITFPWGQHEYQMRYTYQGTEELSLTQYKKRIQSNTFLSSYVCWKAGRTKPIYGDIYPGEIMKKKQIILPNKSDLFDLIFKVYLRYTTNIQYNKKAN